MLKALCNFIIFHNWMENKWPHFIHSKLFNLTDCKVVQPYGSRFLWNKLNGIRKKDVFKFVLQKYCLSVSHSSELSQWSLVQPPNILLFHCLKVRGKKYIHKKNNFNSCFLCTYDFVNILTCFSATVSF